MDVSQKLDIVYSFKTYSTRSNPIKVKNDFLLQDERPLLKFLGQAENLDVDDEKIFDISKSLNLSKFSEPDLENLRFFSNEFSSNRTIDEIRSQEDIYGEINRNGVETLANKLQEHIQQDFSYLEFIDLGSGKGKLLMHLSLITNFKWYTGVELCQNKHSESLVISKKSTITEKLTFINRDMFDLDLSKFDVVFFNDVCFRESLRMTIFRLLKFGCFVITSKKVSSCDVLINLTFIDKVSLECSWIDSKYFYIYRK